VRWPGETGGAFGFALIFLVLFASRQKEQKHAYCIKTKKGKEDCTTDTKWIQLAKSTPT